jgi:gliding motility-associated-like protein
MKYLLLILGFFSLQTVSAQLTVLYPGSTATQLVDKLVGTGVTFSNAIFVGAGSYNGSTEGNKGIFTGGSSVVGISSGIIFSTGNAMLAVGPNNTPWQGQGANGTPGDATLQAIAGTTTYDAVGVQFDFVPESNYIEFRYVFSSEEYNEYVGDIYNDVFGFFVTSLSSDGLNYNSRNIAIVPGTSNTAVAINSINYGPCNGAPYCSGPGIGPGTNASYYRDNATGSINIQYDGLTVVLTASCVVVPCASYRMKIVIADVADPYYDSAVFLEENSFTSPTVDNVQITYSNPAAGANSNAVEGCSNANFLINLTSPTPIARNIPFSVTGTATIGTDFSTTPNIITTYNTLYPNQYYVTIPVGGSSTNLTINPLSDAAVESTESVILTMQSNLCGTPVYSSAQINILDNTTPFTGTVSPSNPSICLGNSVSLAFSPTGGQPPFTYAWSSGQSTSSINANPPASQPYTVTVTDACGNATSATAQVDVYPIPNGSSVPGTQTICSGEITSLVLTGYPSNTSFNWTATASGNVTGHGSGSGTTIAQTLENNGTADATVTYTVTPSANGCSGSTFSATVTIRPHPVMFNVTGGGAFCPNGNGVPVGLDNTETGITYNVYVNGTFVTSFTGTGSAAESAPVPVTGTATIVAVNATTGCSYNMNGNAIISYSPTPQFTSVVIENLQSCVSPDGSITVTAGGTTGPYNYAINGGAFSTDNVFDGLNTGFYTISIEDANGCTSDSAGIQITSASAPVIYSVDVIHNTCPGQNTGQITINSDPGVEYSIDNGGSYQAGNVFTGLPAGTYYILVRDAGSCIASQQVIITAPPAFQITESITNMMCGTPGSASVSVQGGTPPYNYAWSHDPLNTTFSASNLTSGTYYVTITDQNGCTAVEDLIVAPGGGQGIASIVSLNNVTCNGYSDGSTSVQLDNGVPPYSYSWSHNPLLNTATVNNLSAGVYYVTISDSYGCSAVLPINISEPGAITTNITSQDITCYEANNGYISIVPQGGTQPYAYVWNSGHTTSVLTGLQEGDYSVTITDNNGCTQTATTDITEPPQIIVTSDIIHPACYGENNGSISVTISGGTPDYVVTWSNSFSGLVNAQLTAGIYTDTIRDASGCTVINTYSVVNPLPIVVSDTSYMTISGGYAAVSVSGGVSPYTYLWTNGSPATHIDNVPSGFYMVTITDASGCRYSTSFSFDFPLIIPTAITPNNDGKNDDFYISNIQAYTNITIEIFTRWGENIFVYKGTGNAYLDARNRWNGIYKGKDLPMGSYVYIVNLGDGSDVITGTVLLIR